MHRGQALTCSGELAGRTSNTASLSQYVQNTFQGFKWPNREAHQNVSTIPGVSGAPPAGPLSVFTRYSAKKRLPEASGTQNAGVAQAALEKAQVQRTLAYM
jgi:hypothetical protein